MHNPVIKIIIYLFIDFLVTFQFCFNTHGVVKYLIYLRLHLESPTCQVAILFFTYNMVVNRHSDFLAHGLLTGVDVMGYIGLSLLNPSGV